MASYPPPPYPPPPGPPYGGDWKYQRRILKEQARAQRDIARAQRDAYRYQARSLRRSSILGPLLLITIGILFLSRADWTPRSSRSMGLVRPLLAHPAHRRWHHHAPRVGLRPVHAVGLHRAPLSPPPRRRRLYAAAAPRPHRHSSSAACATAMAIATSRRPEYQPGQPRRVPRRQA